MSVNYLINKWLSLRCEVLTICAPIAIGNKLYFFYKFDFEFDILF